MRAALNEGRSGGKLAHFAAANYLRSIGIDNPPDVARIIDVLTNPNSLFGTRGGSQPINPYVSCV